MSILKLNLPKSVPARVDQGKKVVTMSRQVMTGSQPLIDGVEQSTNDLQAKKAAADAARQASKQATAQLEAAVRKQGVAYSNLANQVETNANGSASYILSTGYGIRATPSPTPPLDKVIEVRTSINGTPGRVVLGWKRVAGARNYEVQYTTDLTGATGWVSAPEMPGAAKLNVDNLASGTKYAFRVRACGAGTPGTWSSLALQMAP